MGFEEWTPKGRKDKDIFLELSLISSNNNNNNTNQKEEWKKQLDRICGTTNQNENKNENENGIVPGNNDGVVGSGSSHPERNDDSSSNEDNNNDNNRTKRIRNSSNPNLEILDK